MSTPAERSRAYRDRKRGQGPRVPQPCGTLAAYRRHERAHEPPCDPCRTAWAEAQRRYYKQRKG